MDIVWDVDRSHHPTSHGSIECGRASQSFSIQALNHWNGDSVDDVVVWNCLVFNIQLGLEPRIIFQTPFHNRSPVALEVQLTPEHQAVRRFI